MFKIFEKPAANSNITDHSSPLPLVSLVVPFYNEDTILADTMHTLIKYAETHSNQYRFELILVNDGSTDSSIEIAQVYAEKYPNIHVHSHYKNLGLGQSLQTGFTRSRGDYVIVLDCDLSYSPEHITDLLRKLVETRADVVIASPYMEGGRVSHIPWLRYKLSKWANRFLSYLSHSSVKTLTGMVRGYKGDFIRSLSLRSLGAEINPEIFYKASILNKKIEEIPAHLCWNEEHTQKRSKVKLFRQTSSTILAGFLLKPFLFFILPGLVVTLFAVYTNIWMVLHFFEEYAKVHEATVMGNLTEAFKVAYDLYPHTFLIAFLSSMLSIQLISTGLQSLQSKYYFEELFALQTKIFQKRGKQE